MAAPLLRLTVQSNEMLRCATRVAPRGLLEREAALADMAPATPSNEARRVQMLRAAAELICERGFGETRIADVAKRAEASSALVSYYFGTRERLLVDALRYSEQNFYDVAEKMLAEVTSARERLSLLVRWTCVPEN